MWKLRPHVQPKTKPAFANAIVGAVLFERLVNRDTVDVAVDGATKTRSAFWYVAWTLFGVVAELFCLRVFSFFRFSGAALPGAAP